ncbi:MAG: saccharopine dehydrogenase family protein [Candidatus Hodarchaeota archaeon]
MKILLFGVGMQGKAVLHDLVTSGTVKEIIAADYDLKSLKNYVQSHGMTSKVRCEFLDANDSKIIDQLMQEKPDVIIDLLPLQFVDKIAELAIKNCIHLVNTNYATPKMRALAEKAVAQKVTVLPEFGLDPGIDLVLLGEAIHSFDQIHSIRSYGAGLPDPTCADNPIKYKVTWTLEGVLRSYYRPACLLREGKVIEIDRKDIFKEENVHEIEINGLGPLEAYPSGDATIYLDKIGSKASTLQEMGRYTLRYPGHCAFWKKIVDLHLLDDEPVILEGMEINRRQFLATAIEPHIALKEDERDIALVRVEMTGVRDQKKRKMSFQVLDKRDLRTGLTAMNRTVGFTVSVGAQLIGEKKLKKPGLLSPVEDIPFNILEDELSKRGVEITKEVTD